MKEKQKKEPKKPVRTEITEKGELVDNADISITDVKHLKAKGRKIKPMLNLNQLILGGSGTGKSRYYVKPNLMQCNTSYVVTDPSGELLQSCGKMLERMGYKIKVFNINDMKHSSNYNPFHYLKGYDGKINNNNVIKMINVFMMNTKGEGQSGDPFWDDATRLLLSSVCFLLVETATEEEQNFATVLDLIHKAKVIDGKEDIKSELDYIFDKHKEESPKSLSCQYYDEFKQAAGKTMQSILISTTTKLQHFKLDDMRNLTFTDNIHLETLGDEKTALFIIIPSSDTTFNFLAAMMYTQLFDTLYDRAINYYHGRLPVHVRFILDEFANIGKIPEFEKILATCRKFEISAQIILQNLSQLKRLYEKSWEELPGNCDTVIYLGGKDQSTNEYISKELGKETIDTLSINKTKSKQGSTSYNDGILGRELATIDELGVMDNNNCIVMVRGLHPFFTEKFDIVNHPRYAMLDEYDRDHNTYYLEKNLTTIKETEYVDLSSFFAEDSNATPESTVDIVFVSGDTDKKMTKKEMFISEKLMKFKEIYAQ
ncbi:MAG: type IV secretory system conjugative DNA transfer family protein [Oscillospiraceae bacterium]|nr:type IV secretory system conjugative DNA transfer family protein [Oscillospiraceae bacterium]